uniref:Uncharacterized protein n=1 Tax=Tanacetum cinerariifolium TaxID=118510 RepID=A0A6L2JB45_TANCI|nr:hypothetical protein [Tanacetum cinerariifolium]
MTFTEIRSRVYYGVDERFRERERGRLIDTVVTLVEVAEPSNSRTLPSFHYLRQHDIVEILSQPSKMQSTFNHNLCQATLATTIIRFRIETLKLKISDMMEKFPSIAYSGDI